MDTATLREHVAYDPDTGALVRKTTRAGNARSGQVISGVNRDGYIQAMVCGKFFYGHRLAWQLHYGMLPPPVIDHVNGNRSDNRIENLRAASTSENIKNSRRRSDSTSGAKHVHWNSQKRKWTAKLSSNGKTYYGGAFSQKTDAIRAAELLRAKIHADFARGDE